MRKNIITLSLLSVLVASVVFYMISNSQDYSPQMREMAGEDVVLEHLGNDMYKALRDGHVVGYFDQQEAMAYAGPIRMLVFVDAEGVLKDLAVLKQTETPSFFQKVIGKGFLDKIIGKKADAPFELGQDVDTVTGCTYTSVGIADAVRTAVHHIASSQLNLSIPPTKTVPMPLENYLLLSFFIIVLLLQKVKNGKLRYVTLLAGFLLIGYWQKSLLSLGNFASVLSGSLTLNNMPFWTLLLLGVLVLVLLTGKNLYCYWMCPYGALSELLGRFGKFGGLSYTPCSATNKRFRYLRLLLAWGALVLAFILGGPGISSFEIFAPLFAWDGVKAQWVMLPIILFASVFVSRFWCRFLCPVGGILDWLAQYRRRCGQWIKARLKKEATVKSPVVQGVQNKE